MTKQGHLKTDSNT